MIYQNNTSPQIITIARAMQVTVLLEYSASALLIRVSREGGNLLRTRARNSAGDSRFHGRYGVGAGAVCQLVRSLNQMDYVFATSRFSLGLWILGLP